MPIHARRLDQAHDRRRTASVGNARGQDTDRQMQKAQRGAGLPVTALSLPGLSHQDASAEFFSPHPGHRFRSEARYSCRFHFLLSA